MKLPTALKESNSGFSFVSTAMRQARQSEDQILAGEMESAVVALSALPCGIAMLHFHSDEAAFLAGEHLEEESEDEQHAERTR